MRAGCCGTGTDRPQNSRLTRAGSAQVSGLRLASASATYTLYLNSTATVRGLTSTATVRGLTPHNLGKKFKTVVVQFPLGCRRLRWARARARVANYMMF